MYYIYVHICVDFITENLLCIHSNLVITHIFISSMSTCTDIDSREEYNIILALNGIAYIDIYEYIYQKVSPTH